MHELIFVRHGEAEHHVKGITGAWTDTPLAHRGKRQAGRIANELACHENSRIAPLISSDLLRARQTAEIIAEAAGMQPVFQAELRELNNGDA